MAKPTTGSSGHFSPEKVSSSVERLESRIAPAAVILNTPGGTSSDESQANLQLLAESFAHISNPSQIPPLSQLDLSARVMFVIGGGVAQEAQNSTGGLPTIAETIVHVSNPSQIPPLSQQDLSARVLYMLGNNVANVISETPVAGGELSSPTPVRIEDLPLLAEDGVYVPDFSQILPLVNQDLSTRVLYMIGRGGSEGGLDGWSSFAESVVHVSDPSQVLPLVRQNPGVRVLYVVAG